MIGKTLGSHEILSPLGKGGMGEVWRARDSKLGREVAIKTLPEEFAQDEERLARFEREAKLLASLNHPNIAAIYGLEEDNGTRFLVLELVEGDTLADRLKRGAIPVEESLKLALQIAEALEAAHEKGVIHRDLKPANIKVTPDGKVKVLDFGLAKAFGGDGSDVNLTQSPTLSLAATQQGMILGTAAYMSPEQAKGLPADRRADVFAFGCVLFEMLTGRVAFEGELATEILASVINQEPDHTALQANLHPRIKELLRRCLQKQPKDRWQAVGDVRFEIEQLLSDPNGLWVQPVADVIRAPARPILRWIALAVVLSVMVSGVTVWNLKPEPPKPVGRFPFVLPEGQTFTRIAYPVVAVSPDGTKIAYVANRQLYLRSLDQMDARPIQGTDEDPSTPFFSPDGQWVGYWSAGDLQLKKIAVNGGAPVPLCDATTPFGVSWGTDDTIVFGQLEGIRSVSANGGVPEFLFETDEGEQVHGPQILPGGDSVLFTLTSAAGQSRWDEAQIVVQSLESDDRKLLWPGGSDARYVPTGHLVYALEDVLYALPFDLASLEVTGGPATIVEGVQRATATANFTASANYGFSDGGTLVYVEGRGLETNRLLGLADRNGDVEFLAVTPDRYLHPRLSPDGSRLTVQTANENGSEIWVYDLSGETAIRQLTQGGNSFRPIWTPDGERIAFASTREGPMSIYLQRADGGGLAEPLTTAEGGTAHWPGSFSRDGILSFTENHPTDGNSNIWTLLLEEGAEPELYYGLPDSRQLNPLFSPDGKWLAYWSTEELSNEVYVQPFPAVPGVKHKITQNTGAMPLWSPDGGELFYRPSPAGLGILNGVDVSTEPAFNFSTERTLRIEGFAVVAFHRDYDITPDGERFLMVFPADQTDGEEPPRLQINIVLNWFEELKERVPVP